MTGLAFHFPADHPCGAGHFPDNPIIPGALLLDETLAHIAADLDIQGAIWQIKSAKFPQSARPGDVILANYTLTSGGEIRFECAVSGNKVMSGVARNQTITTAGSSS